MSFWTVGALAGSAIIGGLSSYAGGKQGEKAAKNASKLDQQALDMQNRLAQQQLEIQRPYVQSGQNALNAINRFLGLPGVQGSNYGAGGAGSNPNLVLLPGITTSGVHSKQTNGGGPLDMLKNPINFEKGNLATGIAAPMLGVNNAGTVTGGSALGNSQVYYDRYNDAIVDGAGNVLHANASQMQGDLAGLVSGFNNGVQLNNGTLFGVGSKGPGSLNINLKPLTAAEKAAMTGGGGSADEASINNILNLPGFKYQKQAGNDVINNNLAARGKFFSGQRGAALVNYNNNVTAQQLQQMYLNPLMQVAGFGPGASNAQQGALGQQAANYGNYAQSAGNNLLTGASARASGYAGIGNAINQGLGNYLTYNYLNGRQQAPNATIQPTSWYYGGLG